ncbi:MAG: hypothetical protein FWH01_00985 [Oscillospiraceae bacterium]|nr:hypothetical protein [Oscillospiraceae bacterium]
MRYMTNNIVMANKAKRTNRTETRRDKVGMAEARQRLGRGKAEARQRQGWLSRGKAEARLVKQRQGRLARQRKSRLNKGKAGKEGNVGIVA